jgi:hypothetical protein
VVRTVTNTVTRDRLGAWVLKCNPVAWDLQAFVDSGEGRVTSWSVQPGYRADLMEPGDRVLFWVSGDGRTGFDRGVWGLGHVTAPAEPWVETDPGHWRAAGDAHGIRARVEVDVPLLSAPVTDADLRAVGCDRLEVQRQPFLANPSWVDVDQLAAMGPLLPPWPDPPA